MATTDDSLRTKLRTLKSLAGPFQDVNLDELPDTPHEAFELWLDEAIAAGVKEPHAMTLSTVDERGWPDARVLILKNVDSRGWHFAVNADSPKGQQIAGNNHVALSFYWPQLGRQIRLRGVASRLPDAECAQDFAARPLGSKVSAMATKQSRVLQGRDELLRAVGEAQKTIVEDPDQLLPKWTVYAVAPEAAEFWQGATDRLHQRLQYVPGIRSGQWQKQLLWP